MWWALGAVQQEADDVDAAEKSLRRALVLKDSGLARQSLALVLMKQKRWSEAETVHKSKTVQNADRPILSWLRY